MKTLIYKPAIGMQYRYPSKNRIFELSKIQDYCLWFKCGHSVSECVFDEMIDVATGKLNWQLRGAKQSKYYRPKHLNQAPYIIPPDLPLAVIAKQMVFKPVQLSLF